MNPYLRFPGEQIPFPDSITIALPFAGAAQETDRRAAMEESVDFQRDAAGAACCTLSFAAAELRHYLRCLGIEQVSYAGPENVPEGFVISLSCADAAKAESGYRIAPDRKGLKLHGFSHVGTLYAVYSFLNAQGIRWYYPGSEGEVIPAHPEALYVPTEEKEFHPAMKDGRGLDIFAPLKDSTEFLLWMARNRMNITADHPYSNAFADKLGMIFRIGGHMFEPFLHPDLPLKDGKTIWELHPEWYGLPADGVRRKEDCLKNQFCMSRPDLADYLADILIHRLRGEWKHVDRMDIWGFDNGSGISCQCEDCRKLGNDSDRALHFLSELRSRIDAAKDLHPVTLVACAYEGTKTMEAPTRPIPQNLFAHDCVVCYPIHRCYYHDFDDPACPTNAYYQKTLLPWLSMRPRLPLVMGEYYNVTKYEDLPLIFAKRIRHELPVYAKWGFTSITYMHPPLYNWGVRALNHLLFAELSWDPDADGEALTEQYYQDLYASHADELRAIYERMEQAGAHIGSYRNWWYSVLSSLLTWDGGKPTGKLDLTEHFSDEEELLRTLYAESAMKKDALARIEKVIAAVKRDPLPARNNVTAATPEQLSKQLAGSSLMNRLLELRRSFIYGSDELRLFTLVVQEYVNAERNREDASLWEEIEALYDKMSGYFYPHRYISRKVEAFCEDGLTRSQLRTVIDQRREWKRKNGKMG